MKRTKDGQNKLAKLKNTLEGLPDFKKHHKDRVITTVWYWYHRGQIDQLHRVDSLKHDVYIYGNWLLEEVQRQFNR